MPGVVHSLINSEVFSWGKDLEIPAFSEGLWGALGQELGRPPLEYSLGANMLSHLGRLLPSLGLGFQIHKMGTQYSLRPFQLQLPGERPGIV